MSRFPIPSDLARRLRQRLRLPVGLPRYLPSLRLPAPPPRLADGRRATVPRLNLRLPPLPRLRRAPLPLTIAAILLLVLPPLWLLSRWPRPRAVGLEKLMAAASLLQSFPPLPDRPAPPLWRERLPGPLAESLWQRQRGNWWQFWGVHSDVAPFLALPATGPLADRQSPLPPNSLRIDDLVVIAPDPLALALLKDRLLPAQRRSRGLEGRCVERLRREQTVFWTPQALGVILGEVSPLLQSFQEGCLALEVDPLGLRWQGEAASVEGLLLPLPATPALADVPLQPPLPQDRLLEIEGDELDTLLRGLLSRQIIRDPLRSIYGIEAGSMALLRRAPFRLRLRPLPQGPFQASLELQLEVGAQHQAWKALLGQLEKTLKGRGLMPAATAPASAGTPAAMPRADWKRQDGVQVGGWRWLQDGRGQAQVLLFLGPPPATLDPIGSTSLRPGLGELRLRVRPQAMASLGLLPAEIPQLVQKSDQLWVEAVPLEGLGVGQGVSRLTGRLQLRR